MELPVEPVKRIMRKAGAEVIGKDAVEEIIKFVEDKIEEITKEALKFTRHAGRKTLMARDIKLAL